MRRTGPVTASDLLVAPHLPADPRRTASKICSDRPHRRARGARQPNLFTLSEGQTPAPQSTPTPRAHTAVDDHPPSALLAISTSCYRRVGDELATLQPSPEHLHVLRDHVISEPDDQHLHSVRCCDHRENPSNPYRRYRRTANRITSAGNRKPTKPEGILTGGRERRVRFIEPPSPATMRCVNATEPDSPMREPLQPCEPITSIDQLTR